MSQRYIITNIKTRILYDAYLSWDSVKAVQHLCEEYMHVKSCIQFNCEGFSSIYTYLVSGTFVVIEISYQQLRNWVKAAFSRLDGNTHIYTGVHTLPYILFSFCFPICAGNPAVLFGAETHLEVWCWTDLKPRQAEKTVQQHSQHGLSVLYTHVHYLSLAISSKGRVLVKSSNVKDFQIVLDLCGCWAL